MKSFLGIVTLSALLFGLPSALNAAEHTNDSPDKVKKAVTEDKAVLIDVRERREWDAGHLKEAKLVPLSLLDGQAKPDELEKLLPKNKVIYLHCKSGGRCLLAADLLEKQGYEVRPLKEGYEDLLKNGFEKDE